MLTHCQLGQLDMSQDLVKQHTKKSFLKFQVTCAIIQRLIDDNKDLHTSTYARFLHLGLGLCFLGIVCMLYFYLQILNLFLLLYLCMYHVVLI